MRFSSQIKCVASQLGPIESAAVAAAEHARARRFYRVGASSSSACATTRKQKQRMGAAVRQCEYFSRVFNTGPPMQRCSLLKRVLW